MTREIKQAWIRTIPKLNNGTNPSDSKADEKTDEKQRAEAFFNEISIQALRAHQFDDLTNLALESLENFDQTEGDSIALFTFVSNCLQMKGIVKVTHISCLILILTDSQVLG